MSKTETKPTINQKIAELESMTEWFYGEEFSLDEALPKYQSATKLAHEITKDLDELENQVKIVADFTKD